MKIKIIRLISVLLVIVGVGLYVYGIVVNGDKPTDNLVRTILILFSGLSVMAKTMPRRMSVKQYAAAYGKELGDAFSIDLKKRENLLGAIRLYDEGKYAAAMKMLESLKMDACTRDEIYAVWLFTALCQTGLGLNEAVIATYQEAIQKGAVSSLLYSNLGARYAAAGDGGAAAKAYAKAIEMDENNALAHNNFANLLLQIGEYDLAADAAMSAVEINPEQYQAWTVLAIVAAVKHDDELQKEFFQKAVRYGQQEEALRAAINHYINLA